jgi:hypothetical protein
VSEVLLVGNGPNYFSKGVSWRDVVRATAKHARIQNEVERLLGEPLPLVYERIASQYPSQERVARAEFVEEMQRLKANEIHEELMALNCRTILTTNYDNCLEVASGEKFDDANLASELKYSVFRRKRSVERSLWHIHGDMNVSRSLMLGFNDYAGYLHKLRNYMTSKDGSPFLQVSNDLVLEDVRHSWMDLFLRDNVHIVGLGLGYEEVVLWWLISYKQRLRFTKKVQCGQTTYYHAGEISKSTKGRLELMEGLGVRVEHIKSSSATPTRETWGSVIALLKVRTGSTKLGKGVTPTSPADSV